jgi:hypothetical protein
MRIDFSAGIAEEVPSILTIIQRGSSAQSARRSLKRGGERLLREQILDPKNMQVDRAFTPLSVTFQDDFENNTFTIIQTGRSRTHWIWNEDVNRAEFGTGAGGLATRIRRDGQYKDVPIAIGFPSHTISRFEYVLPNGGAGFEVRGAQGQIASGARDISVVIGIRDGVAFSIRRDRSFAGEMTLAEHDGERRFNQDQNDRPFVLRAPAGMPRPPMD